MAKKLYVGNLSYGTTDSDLQGMFEEFGTVESAQVIIDRDSGRSKGFGFVEMRNDQEAQAAINALNGKDVDGRSLTVNEARPREDRGWPIGWRRRRGPRRLRRRSARLADPLCKTIGRPSPAMLVGKGDFFLRLLASRCGPVAGSARHSAPVGIAEAAAPRRAEWGGAARSGGSGAGRPMAAPAAG